MNALPALLKEVVESAVRRRVVEPTDVVEDPGRAIDAEPALAGTHRQPQEPPDVIEARRPASLDRLFEAPARDQLALADDLVRLRERLSRGEPRTEPVGGAAFRSRQRLLGRPAPPPRAEVLADCVDRDLG